MDKFKQAIIIGFIVVLFISIFDVYCMQSGVFGTPEDYTNGNYTQGWWNVFHNIVLFVILSVGILYYLFYRKDKSEAIAVSLVPYILWRFGLADILYFLVQGKTVPAVLPWLNQAFPINMFFAIGGAVTASSLYVSTAIGIIISIKVAYYLKNKL